MLYVIIGIFIFGILIATHELGHFTAAKALGVKVNEFSIGMGPALLSTEKGETQYSLRVLPIGGYCAMEGEDDDSSDPRSFGRAAGWKKLIILCAGAAMNFVTGLIVLAVFLTQISGFAMPALAGFLDGYGLESCGLQANDIVLSVDGERMFSIYGENRLLTALDVAGDTVDMVVFRGGQRVVLNDLYMPRQERVDEAGNVTRLRGLQTGYMGYDPGLGERLVFSWYGAVDMVRVVWGSLASIVSGDVGLRDLSGPVGIVDTMTEVGEESETPVDAAMNLSFLAAFIAVNLAVMNLLPLPALDGGRIFFLLLNGGLMLLFKKKIDPKYEGYVHMAGMLFLLGLMMLVTLSDVGRLFGR